MDEEAVQLMEKELEELRPLKDTTAKFQEEFKQKEEAWQKEKALLEESANPNWPKVRKSMETMRAALEEKGVKVDVDGNVISNPQHVDVEKIRQEATQAARGEILGSRLNEFLSEYDESSGKLVKHFYDKLTAGEEVNSQNMSKFIRQAHLAAEAELGGEMKKSAKAVQFSGGQGPRVPGENAVDETKRQELGSMLGLTFASKKK